MALKVPHDIVIIAGVDASGQPQVLRSAPDPSGGQGVALSIALPTALYTGQTNVTTAGTRVVLAGSQALLSGVTVKAKSTNAGQIFVGNSAVSSSNGHRLSAGESCFIEIANLASVYVDAATNGEGVSYIGS